MTDELSKICETPQNKRDLSWEKAFLKAFPVSSLYLKQDAPFAGPDGFSYMELSTEPGPQNALAEALDFEDFISWSYESGLGWVVNLKEKKAPDYVFSYGMICNYILRQEFLTQPPKDIKKVAPDDIDKIYIHEISEGYLPQITRDNVRNFLSLNKIENVFISLVSAGDQTEYELLFYFENSKLEQEDKKTLLTAVSWFLPLHYRLAWSEKKPEDYNFQAL